MLQGLVSQFQLMQLIPPRIEMVPFFRDILNEAADEKKRSPFNKYESTYYGGMGYFITAFYGIKSVRVYS